MYISPVPYLVVGFSEDQIFYSQNNEKKKKKLDQDFLDEWANLDRHCSRIAVCTTSGAQA